MSKTHLLRKLRVPLAIFASAVMPAIVYVILRILTDYQHTDLNILISTWILVFVIAMAHAVCLGLPSYLVLKRFNLTQWWISLIFGFLIGAIPWALTTWPSYSEYGSNYMIGWLKSVTSMGMCGMASGFTAWYTWWSIGDRKD